jgi:hypothetical protein
MAEQDTTTVTETPAPPAEAKSAKTPKVQKATDAAPAANPAAEEAALEARLADLRAKRAADEMVSLSAPAPSLAECNAQARAADEASRQQRIDVQEALLRLGVKGQVPVRPPTFPVDQQVR